MSHQVIFLAYCVLQCLVLLYIFNIHENFFGTTITKHTSTTNEHPFPQRDLIPHQSWFFRIYASDGAVIGTGSWFLCYWTLFQKCYQEKFFWSIIYFIVTGVICKLKISTHVWGVPWTVKAVSSWRSAEDVRLFKTSVRVYRALWWASQKNSVFNCTGLRAINVASLILLAAFTSSHSAVILIYRHVRGI